MKTKKALFLETANLQCDEMGRCLASSEDYLTRLQKVTDIAMDEIQVVYYAGVHKHYQNAIKAHEALKVELAKAAPAKTVVQMNALTIYNEITSAETERNELQHKMNISAPEMKPEKN